MKLQKSIIKAMIALAVIVLGSCIIMYEKVLFHDIKASNTNGLPDGEYIVDIFSDPLSVTSPSYALTNKGYVYSWGINIGVMGQGLDEPYMNIIKPGLVKCNPGDCGDNEYLNNIKKIVVTYGVHVDGRYKARAFALANDGKVYAWGSNFKYALGLPEIKDYPLPTLVNLDFKVKDITTFPANKSKTDSGIGTISYLISEDGDLYGVGDGRGIGVSETLTTFTKIPADINGNAIRNVKQLAFDYRSGYHYILLEDGRILYGINSAGTTDFFKSPLMKDGTSVTDINSILFIGDVIDVFIKKDNKIVFGKNNQFPSYQEKNDHILFSNGNTIEDFSYIDNMSGQGLWLIDKKGKIYHQVFNGNSTFDYDTLKNTGVYTTQSEYILANQTSLAVKATGNISSKRTDLVLTQDHNVFYQGKKLMFGNITLNAKKSDDSDYTDAEHYNDNVMLSIDTSNSEYNSALMYRIRNLDSNKVSDDMNVPSGNKIIIEPTDKTRRYETYEIFQQGYEQDTLKKITIDLYKDTPNLSGLTEGAKYNIDKSFTLPNDWNPYTATLQKGSDPTTDYTSGTAIHDEGDYVLTLKDSYGNEKAYNFSIIDVATPESLLFTKSGNLVYGDTSTSANKQIGTLSLKYPVDATKFGTLKTAILGTGGNEDKFTIDPDDNTKLMVKENLSVGDYTLHISGVDTNNMPYDDTITFTIAPAGQDGADDGFKFNDTIASGEMFYGNTLDLSTIVTGGASSITPKFTVLHDYGSGAVITDGKITPTNIGSFELEAKKEDPDGNYTTATITKTITVKPKPITISVKDPITKKAGAALPAVGDNYTITPALVSGDTLSGTPVYEYIGSADNNSTSNVKVKISGLSNDKYDITFTEHDVTVTQDTNGTEGTNYEITGTKGENNWYTSDVTFKLLGPALTAGYDLFSNTNTFSTDNFIVNSEGKNSVKFRMKNSTTGALTSQDTKEIKIDKTAPVISKIDYAEKDGNNKTPVTDKTFAYYFVHGVDIKVQASDVTSGIVKYKMVATPLNNDGTVDDTKSKISEETASTEGTHKFTISQQGNFEIEITIYDEAGNSVSSTKVKAKINENTGELTAKALINNDASKPYDGSNWTNQKINITLNCTNDSGVSSYLWSNDGGTSFNKMTNNKLEISNTSTINNVEYSFKAMTNDGNELTATLPIKIDVTKPTVTGIQYSTKTRNALQSFLNTVTFDHYFKEEQTATFQGEDNESGIDTFEYSVTRVDKNLKPIGTADKGTGKTYDLELDKNYKVELYALDKAGNKSAEPVFSETVSIDSTLGDLELEAYINDDTSKPYDGSKWVHEPIAVHLNVKGNTVIDEYAYSSGGNFTKCDTNVCTIPADSNINDKEYSFRTKDENGNVTTKKMNIKIDITKPLISVDAKTGNHTYIEGDTATEDITLELNKENTNLSGSELFYTKDAQVASKSPSLVNGWKAYKNIIVIDTSGEETYYFASMSGAGVASEVKEFHTKLMKLDYNDIKIEATSNGKRYTGDWTNNDVTFTIRGGIEDTTLIQNYQYAITTGSAPDSSTVWNNVSGNGQHIVSGNTNKTYWFRVVPVDGNGKTSQGYSVKIDTVKPDDVTFKTKSVAKGVLNSIADLLTTGDWSNSALQVEMESGDHDSGIKEIKYIETKNGTQGSQKVYSAPLIYKEDGIISFKATAYDNAGNASQNESISDMYRIDVTRPTIKGAEDGKVYYYVPRYITYEDLGSGIKNALVSFNNGAFDTLNNGHKLSAEGDYTIKVSDVAGNVHEINFKIVGLPDMDDIDGSDESRDIIDQVIDEYEEVKNELTPDEKKEIEEWIDEAEKKWEAARNKIIKDESSGVIVEGVDNVTFDPNTELVVKKDESVKDKDISKVPGIDKNEEIKEGFDVKLKKGEMVVQPDGSVTIKIPIRNEYKYSRMKVVMIDDKGEISLVNAEVKNGYIEFTTDKPNNKFALVGEKEKDPNLDKDTDGDGLPDVNVDVDGDGKADINIDTDGDGIPDINIDTDGDGKPDYNVDRDGDKKPDYNVGPIHKPWKPDLCVDYDEDGTKDWCSDTYHKPYLNIDTDGDGLPDLNLDIDGDMKADINIDIDNNNIPDLNIDSDGDGKADINIDDDNDGKADRNIKKLTEWIPDKNDGKVNGFTFDTMGGLKPDEVNGGNSSNNNNTSNGGTSGGSSSGNSGTSVKGAAKTNTLSNVGGAGTGDTTNWLWWIVCLVLSASTLVITRLMKRHKKMN